MALPVRVLLADDTPDIRLLLRVALELHGSFDVVGEAVNGQEAVQLATEHQPDVVLLDLSMPVMDGLEATPLILEGSPASKVVILSGFDARRMEAQAMAQGAHVYLEKGTRTVEVIDAILGLAPEGTPRPNG